MGDFLVLCRILYCFGKCHWFFVWVENEEGKCAIAMFFYSTVRSAITLALLFSNSRHPRIMYNERLHRSTTRGRHTDYSDAMAWLKTTTAGEADATQKRETTLTGWMLIKARGCWMGTRMCSGRTLPTRTTDTRWGLNAHNNYSFNLFRSLTPTHRGKGRGGIHNEQLGGPGEGEDVSEWVSEWAPMNSAHKGH